ncbi:pyridoxal phosphate-dependent aminotransferase [Pseudohalocynthiibacter aestuariivivens]|uniref:histidinol-phosphate transaminase n=1 Tax=Pseudohalocynthiibacter aestuariivivens TaxID=1591409 RepID=A0ABV5JDX4_9RHOB|nr:pyridoxal phosphate-dependent aminotransferase [Pseudohalocynthiibacter aestuariivivens]MBS9718346.1 pyridoxal phosphate-dependent aminotransferase [Pseudohalocynthiibacter aestuariivivens]
MTEKRLTPLAASLPATVPFVGPETQERARGSTFAARLGANENVFGPSPSAIKAMERAASEIWMYADPESYDLRAALAAHHGIPSECIMVGEGIDGLLGYLVRLFVGPGDMVVTSEGAYPTFNYHVAGFGGALVTVPYRGDHEDPEALVARAAVVGAKLIYLANPDNPMGSWHSAKTIQSAIERVPAGSLLVLDEAYVELAEDGVAPAWDVTDSRVIRMRTFSKAYGMAGARVGYAVGSPEIIAAFNKVRNHFGMNRAAQAGALAALADQAYLEQTCRNVADGRERISQIAAQNGLAALPSATNFVAIDCGQDGTFAKRVLSALVSQGIFVRMPFVAPQDRCIRVSAGRPDDLDAFEALLPKALTEARG